MNYPAPAILRTIIAFAAIGPFAGLTAQQPAAPGPPKTAGFSLLPKSFQRDPHLNISVITEVTELGKLIPSVSVSNPAYYELISAGFRQIGDAVMTEKTLVEEQMTGYLEKALARSGFLRAEPENDPSYIIIYTWGSHNLLTHIDFRDSELFDQRGNYPHTIAGPQSAPAISRNLLDRAALIGGDKVAEKLARAITATQDMMMGYPPPPLPRFNPIEMLKGSDPMVRYIIEEATDDIYFVVASAYEHAPLDTPVKKLLWRTKITVNARGISQIEVLPSLIIAGGDFFGKDMEQMQVVGARLREGRVDVGTPTVMPDLPPAESPNESQ